MNMRLAVHGFALLATASVVLSGPRARAVEHGDAPTARSAAEVHLLVVVNSEECPAHSNLDCIVEKTASYYRQNGARVTVRSEATFRQWLKDDGRDPGKAHPMMQRLAYAKANDADVIAGYSCFKPDAKFLQRFPGKQQRIDTWDINLRTCTTSGHIEELGDQAVFKIGAAFPGGLATTNTVGGIPTAVRPLPFGSNPYSLPAEPRAMLGVKLDGQRVIEIAAKSPAEAAGVEIDDEIQGLGRVEIDSFRALFEAVGKHKPGDRVEIVLRRSGSEMRKSVVLGNAAEFVESKKRALLGRRAPDLSAIDADGNPLRLGEFEGKVVLLSFWATWCGPCKQALPGLQLVSERLSGEDFVWIGVSVDEDERAWRDFVRNNKLGGRQIRAPKWAEAFGVDSFPTEVLLDHRLVTRGEARADDVLAHAIWLLKQR